MELALRDILLLSTILIQSSCSFFGREDKFMIEMMKLNDKDKKLLINCLRDLNKELSEVVSCKECT
jgi:hypothetical protein